MLSKNQIKLIKSLTQKKYRQQHSLFTVEGVKGITEFLNSRFQLESLYATEAIFDVPNEKMNLISSADLKRISGLKNPNMALAIFKIPKPINSLKSGLIVALDDVRDPGNLGTIIRLCDWFGISDVVCSETSVDCFNPKVVQASMGSLTRVNIHYQNLTTFLNSTSISIYTAVMDGNDLYQSDLTQDGIIVFGNEANGISAEVEALATERLTIPRFGSLKATESLNVANAAAIVLSEFKRRSTER